MQELYKQTKSMGVGVKSIYGVDKLVEVGETKGKYRGSLARKNIWSQYLNRQGSKPGGGQISWEGFKGRKMGNWTVT